MSPTYYTYVVRWWAADEDVVTSDWRFVLEVPATGEKEGFTDLEALLEAIRREFTTATNKDVVIGKPSAPA